MYCKHCGKQIDEDSTFCKYCGKSLENPINSLEDSTNSSDNPNKSVKSLFNINKKRIDIILVLVLWLFIGAIVLEVSHSFSFGQFSLLLVTIVIVGILYRLYKNHCKYPISFFDKSDTKRTKVLKYIYLAYTAFIPLHLIEDSSTPEDYFIALMIEWLIPTLFICGAYYIENASEAKK